MKLEGSYISVQYIPCKIERIAGKKPNLFKFKLDLFYNYHETSYILYINHARWHRCLCSDGLLVGGNRSTQRKPLLSDLVTT